MARGMPFDFPPRILTGGPPPIGSFSGAPGGGGTIAGAAGMPTGSVHAPDRSLSGVPANAKNPLGKLGKWGKFLKGVGGPILGLMVVNEIVQSAREAKQKAWMQGVNEARNISQMIDTQGMQAEYAADQMSLLATAEETRRAGDDSGAYNSMLAKNLPLLQMLSAPPPRMGKIGMVSNTVGL